MRFLGILLHVMCSLERIISSKLLISASPGLSKKMNMKPELEQGSLSSGLRQRLLIIPGRYKAAKSIMWTAPEAAYYSR